MRTDDVFVRILSRSQLAAAEIAVAAQVYRVGVAVAQKAVILPLPSAKSVPISTSNVLLRPSFDVPVAVWSR